MFVSDIMTEKVQTVSPTQTLKDLRDIFRGGKHQHTLVEEDGKLVGIISEKDAISRLSPFLGTSIESKRDLQLLTIPAGKLMNTDMTTVDRNTLVECASILLLEKNLSCLPVVGEDNSIEGIVSWKDLLQYSVYAEKEPA